MKFILFLLAAFFFNSFEQKSANLTITVANVKNERGVVRVLLFKDGDGFPSKVDKAFKNASVSIRGDKATISFNNIPEGTYALSAFHDSLNAGKLRTNVLGIPSDSYGFSNNASGTFGPPSYKDAAFKVTAGQNEVSIKLK